MSVSASPSSSSPVGVLASASSSAPDADAPLSSSPSLNSDAVLRTKCPPPKKREAKSNHAPSQAMLEKVLELEEIDTNMYRGYSPPVPRWGRVYGGLTCLLSSTLVGVHGGPDIPASAVTLGTRLIGVDSGPVTVVGKPFTGEAETMVQVVHAQGQMTVTPNHLVTLRWGVDPSSRIREHSRWQSVQLRWYDNPTGQLQSVSWRFVGQKGGPVVLPDNAAYIPIKNEAAEAAIAFGDELIARGLAKEPGYHAYTSGMVYSKANDGDRQSTSVLLRLQPGAGGKAYDSFHFRIGPHPHRRVVDLPRAMEHLAMEYTHFWLLKAEAAGLVTPLRLGDLFEVQAGQLAAHRRANAAFAAEATIPMVVTERPLVSSAAKFSASGPDAEPIAAAPNSCTQKQRAHAETDQKDEETSAVAGPAVFTDEDTDEVDGGETMPNDARWSVAAQEEAEWLRAFMVARGLDPADMDSGIGAHAAPAGVVYPRVVTVHECPSRGAAEPAARPTRGCMMLEDKQEIIDRYCSGATMPQLEADYEGLLTQKQISAILYRAKVLRSSPSLDLGRPTATGPTAPGHQRLEIDQVRVENLAAGRDAHVGEVAELHVHTSSHVIPGASELDDVADPRAGASKEGADVVYMLHNPLLVEEGSLDANLSAVEGGTNPGAFSLQQLERAWKLLHLDQDILDGAVHIRMVDLDPLVVAAQAATATSTRDSRLASFDAVCVHSMAKVLALNPPPKAIVALGSLMHDRWLEAYRSLGASSWAAAIGAESIALDLDASGAVSGLVLRVRGQPVRVTFAGHPSASFLFDTVLRAVGRAHQVDPQAIDRTTNRCHSVSRITRVSEVAGGQYIGFEVDRDHRFVLSDGSVVHNCSQALVASCRTVDPSFIVHSLHSYFLRPGNDDLPIMYYVERLREGRSFATRRVTAMQKGKAIFAMMVSFMTLEDGCEHQDVMPVVPPPEQIRSLMETYHDMLKDPRLTPRIRKSLERSISLPFPVDVRRVQPRDLAERLKKGPAVQRSWVKVSGQMSDSLMLHQCALAYMSDWALLETTLLPHGLHGWISEDDSSLQMASIDHSMWFHHSFRADEWLLYDMDSPSASGGRGFARGRFFNQDGKLIVSTAQEGLIRVHQGPPPPIRPVGSTINGGAERNKATPQAPPAANSTRTSDAGDEAIKAKL